MVDLNKQYQCSSKAISYNTTIFSKRRQTYLIVDIEPVIDNSQPLDDRSISSLFKDYYTYAKVRQSQSGIGMNQYYFKRDEYANIIDGSISWDGTPFVKQEVLNTIDTLKNATVIVRPSYDCTCKSIEATIVDPNTMLLRNLATNGYFYADSRSIEYSSVKPDDGGTTVRFEFKNSSTNFNGTLSYLMRGITWLPSYDLCIQDDNTCSFQAYANIRNNQQQEYQINNTYFYSGDIQLANSYSLDLPYLSILRVAETSQAMANQSSIQADGEQEGFYFYSLKDNYTLHPKSSIRLPFITINVKCNFYYIATTSIGTGEYNGAFQRYYDITPDKFLPAGTLTIRDNQILIGQSSLPDVPVNYTKTITQGEDNDVQYVINGVVTASNKDPEEIAWHTYELLVKISNYKNKDVSGQLDFYGATQTNIEKTTCNSTNVNGNLIDLPFQVKKNANYQCRITVTLKMGINSRGK
ncbi:unnamed protein product [Rotaria magnacalcarata]|uniref:Uncharacterized protein n=1 Tax=Rotaria magnacalcarata TaxID=392030 RepID=A0A8S2L7H2_9BILA|nr:unnamed protein product [Rotaria magnacalcarata]